MMTTAVAVACNDWLARHRWYLCRGPAFSIQLVEIAPLEPKTRPLVPGSAATFFLGFIQLPRLRRVWHALRAAVSLRNHSSAASRLLIASGTPAAALPALTNDVSSTKTTQTRESP